MIEHVKVSAPLTLNMVGVGDSMSFLYLKKQQEYCTVTASLESRIELELRRNGTDEMRIEYCVGDDPPIIWTGNADDYDFAAAWGVLHAAWAYYGLTGLDAIIRTPLDVESGLGGMEALALCSVGGCTEIQGQSLMNDRLIVGIACELVRAVQPYMHVSSIFGSLHGGIRFWNWVVPLSSSRSKRIMSSDNFFELENRIVIAMSSAPLPQKNPRAFARGCLSPVAAGEMGRANEVIPGAVDSLRVSSWRPLIDCIRNEQAIAADIDIQRAAGLETLENAPGVAKGSFGIVDYGQQGCWFLSDKGEDAVEVKGEWATRNAIILDVKFSDTGLR